MRDRVAIVTGASSGIGCAAAAAFAAEGASVVVADLLGDRGRDVVARLEADGTSAAFVETDVSDPASVERMVGEAISRFGRLDYAFNNAGIEGEQAPTSDCSIDNWTRTLAVNLTGVWLCMRAEIPQMLAAGGGVIVNNASVAGLVGFAGIPAYTASKHGVVGLTKTAALEYATQNLRINAVCPGVIQTEMIDRFTHGEPQVQAALLATEPVGRLGLPSEIADAVVWLCSERASFVTGQAIAVDGGFVAR